MTALTYIDVFDHNLRNNARKSGLVETYFKLDQDPEYSGYKTNVCLLHNAPRRHETLPQYPDLHSIEYLWHLLDLQVRKCSITSKLSLKDALENAWNIISPNVTKYLVDTMPRPMIVVIAAKVLNTK
ncbi:transposable element Tc1 transposase [Nephila pilipes]|uniref:Transposable element Tc1 transposase n=1 Tax=Nephila pilipes TaxID=299642 RepID=A0A8X6N6K9_NEPPI|nr:transposable element Tc1 transposase [Nephila pilipes]